MFSYVCPTYRRVDGKGKIKILLISVRSVIYYVLEQSAERQHEVRVRLTAGEIHLKEIVACGCIS